MVVVGLKVSTVALHAMSALKCSDDCICFKDTRPTFLVTDYTL